MVREFNGILLTLTKLRSSTIIETVKGLLCNDPNGRSDNLAYFYFSFGDASSHDVDSLLRSIVYQLCQRQGLPPKLRSIYSKRHFGAPVRRDLFKALVSILNRLGGRADDFLGQSYQRETASETYLIFDGIDEIPHGTPRDTVLQLLRDISMISNWEHVHLLITSRDERDIAAYLPLSKGWQRCGLYSSQVNMDIAAYTTTQMTRNERLNALPHYIKERVQTRLVGDSNGM